ncbi:MAG: ATP-dependent helicase [Candidatus Pacearchaeota archaeon]
MSIDFKELEEKKILNNNFFNLENNIITDKERIIFNELDFYLKNYNDEQKKAIVSNEKRILCIAGAGTGKTSVLTKRIEFLVKYRGVKSEKILAITFTKKAKEEMQKRLINLGIKTHVETFNSFCEKILKKYGNIIYGKHVKVMNYEDKVISLNHVLSFLNININTAIDKYFSEFQKKNKEINDLYNIFMDDCFFILDYFKLKNKDIYDFSQDASFSKDKEISKIIYLICKNLKNYMNLYGFRDYTDQIIDCIKYFKENKNNIPYFYHILVDEYQDINSIQVELLDLLSPDNLFVVGDPRQSIFGWRGSNIKFILNFKDKYKDSEVIVLSKNYRSNNHIVKFMNACIKDLNFPDISHSFENKKQISILNFDNENQEFLFVIDKILKSKIPRNEIFILARTNRQINELSKIMKQMSIKHIVKTDETSNSIIETRDDITLATIHSIKGLEAEMVFLIGANEQNFPCKTQDHPIIDLIKIEEYNTEEEEKRLFYVAISRAKNILYITYTGKKPTRFINKEMFEISLS